MYVTTSLVHLAAKISEVWTQIGFKLNEDMFKVSRYCQERFIQELCCNSFATASASWPYSSLRTSSRTWSGILGDVEINGPNNVVSSATKYML